MHAEILIEKQYRNKDLSEGVSDSAIFVGYCRQSSGYVFYVPNKHVVVSRRDATFNEGYLPARVGDTQLISSSTLPIIGAEEDNSTNDAKK